MSPASIILVRGMEKAARYGTVVVAAHAVVLVLHSMAHTRLGIWPSTGELVFIATVIVAAPVVAAVILWTRLRHAGAWLLLGSMAGSLIFGVHRHFAVPSPDHILHVPPERWGMVFSVTAVLLAVTEAAGCWGAVYALRAWRRTPDA